MIFCRPSSTSPGQRQGLIPKRLNPRAGLEGPMAIAACDNYVHRILARFTETHSPWPEKLISEAASD